MKMPPPISIGMPVYNGEAHLAKALDTTLGQTFGDFELIICDNASTDATPDICRDYAARDGRIQYVRNKANMGASRNYKLAFALSSGKYFRWANHDDTTAASLLEKCFHALEETPSAVLAYGRTTLIDSSDNPISGYDDGMHIEIPNPAERFQYVLHNSGLCNIIYGLMRREPMRNTALMAPYRSSDLHFVAELALYGTFLEIPESLFFRRIHPGAYSSQKDANKQAEFYDPKLKAGGMYTAWQQLWADIKAIERSPLSTLEKFRLRLYLCRRAAWKKSQLAREAGRFLYQHCWRTQELV